MNIIVNYSNSNNMRQRNLNPQSKQQTENYGSTYSVESDQKDVILSKLKSEVEGLKKNEQQFHRLKEQYQDMDWKYRTLQQQKANQDRDFKTKHESYLKHICQLKNQTQALRAELRDKKLQIGDMETDSNTLRNTIDQRNIELDRFRSQLNGLFADTDELESERMSLIRQLEDIRRCNNKTKQEAQSLNQEENKTMNRTLDLTKYHEQLQIEGQLLKDKIKTYEDNNNQLDEEINEVIQDVSEIENQIYDSQAEIGALQTALAELSADCEKYRSEAIHNQKATQGEVMKNNDLVKQIKQSEHILGVRINQGEEGRKEVRNLAEENDNLEKINDQLQQDMEACRRHLQNLGLLNNQLIRNLQGFSQEDNTVRNLIDRREKVTYLGSRIQEANSFGNFGKTSSRTESTVASRRNYSRY